MKSFRITAYGRTDIGRKRTNNQDSIFCDPELGFFCVADGMGGHQGGEIASSMVVEILKTAIERIKTSNYQVNRPTAYLKEVISIASARIHERASHEPELEGMGTTVVCIYIQSGVAYIAHVGDSRAYLIRNGVLLKIMEDHSLVNEQLRSGVITKAQANTIEYKNVITRSVGFEELVDVDIYTRELEDEDTFLICSDGLTSMVKEKDIFGIIKANDIKHSVDKLINEANNAGGTDNTSIIIFKVDSNDKSEKHVDSEDITAKKIKKDWFIRTADHWIYGPFDLDTLRNNVAKKKFVSIDEASHNGEDWKIIKNIKELNKAAGIDLFEDETTATQTGEQNPSEKTANPPSFTPIKKEETEEEQQNTEITSLKDYQRSKWHFISIFISIGLTVLIFAYFVFSSKNKTGINIADIEQEISKSGKDDVEIFNNYYLKGKEYEDAGLYEDAYRLYNNALTIRPSDVKVRLLKARLEMSVINKVESAEHLLHGLHTDYNIGKVESLDDQADIKNYVGILEFKKNNIEAALGYFNQALSIRPNLAYPHYNLGRIFFKRGKIEQAMEYFKQAVKLSPMFLDAMVFQGRALMKLGMYAQASEIFYSAQILNVNRREPHTMGAYSYFRTGDIAMTAKLAEAVFELDPYYSKKELINFDIVEPENSIDEEINYIKEINQKLGPPEYKNEELIIALLYFIKGETQKAYASISNLNSIPALNINAILAFFEGKYPEAEAKFKKVIETDYSDPVAHLYLGKLRMMDNDLTHAMNHFNKSRSSIEEPITLEAMLLLGDIYVKMGQAKEAILIWQKILSIDPKYIPAKQRVLFIDRTQTR